MLGGPDRQTYCMPLLLCSCFRVSRPDCWVSSALDHVDTISGTLHSHASMMTSIYNEITCESTSANTFSRVQVQSQSGLEPWIDCTFTCRNRVRCIVRLPYVYAAMQHKRGQYQHTTNGDPDKPNIAKYKYVSIIIYIEDRLWDTTPLVWQAPLLLSTPYNCLGALAKKPHESVKTWNSLINYYTSRLR